MPRKIKCRFVKENPFSKKKEPCDSELFENIVELYAVSGFESQNGQPQMQMVPGFRCIDCGTILNVKEEMQSVTLNLNGV